MRTHVFILGGVAAIAAGCSGSTVTETTGGGAGQGGLGGTQTTASGNATATSSTAGSSTGTGMGGQPSSTGSGGGTTSSSSSASTGPASSGSAGGCPPDCGIGLTCCGDKCVNLANDILNCGMCGQTCQGQHPYCNGTCEQPPCSGMVCSGVTFCCGAMCCALNQLCCTVPGGPVSLPSCYDPTPEGTCPVGCPGCP